MLRNTSPDLKISKNVGIPKRNRSMLGRPRTHTQPAAAARSQATKNNHALTNSHEQPRARKQPGTSPQSQTAMKNHALAYRKEQQHTHRHTETAMRSKTETDKHALREREREREELGTVTVSQADTISSRSQGPTNRVLLASPLASLPAPWKPTTGSLPASVLAL